MLTINYYIKYKKMIAKYFKLLNDNNQKVVYKDKNNKLKNETKITFAM